MPYISTERVAEIRSELKKTFPEYTFRCYREHSSSVHVHIMSGPANLESTEKGGGYYSVNVYYIDEHYRNEPEKLELFQKIKAIVSRGNGTLVNDGDYGRVPNFYEHICVGDYQKPYQQVKAKEEAAQVVPGVCQGTGTGAKVRFNEDKGGIEIVFPAKPDQAVLDNLKANGFKWSKFNKCWWIKDSPRARAFVASFEAIPESDNDGAASMVEANENSLFDNWAAANL